MDERCRQLYVASMWEVVSMFSKETFFFIRQQFGELQYVGFFGGGANYRVYQALLNINFYVDFHAEGSLVAFSGLRKFWITLVPCDAFS